MAYPFTDLTYEVREVRFQAIHVDGADPSLAGVSVFMVDESGQWHTLVTWDVGPFDGQVERDDIERHCAKLLRQILS